MQFIEQVIKVAFGAENAHLHITNIVNRRVSSEWWYDDRIGGRAESPSTAKFHQANRPLQESLGDKFNNKSGVAKGSLKVGADVLPRRDTGCAAR